MRTFVFCIIIFITMFCEAQEHDGFVYLRNDTITNNLYNYLDEDVTDYNFLSEKIIVCNREQNNEYTYQKKKFIKKIWGELVKYYKGTDLIILRNKNDIHQYLVYNRCYKHLFFFNNKMQLVEIVEVENAKYNDLPCFESKRVF